MNKQLLYRLAGGSLPCPAEVRAASHRLVVGGSDSDDIKIVSDYIKTLDTQDT
jgi:hypothetical protein